MDAKDIKKLPFIQKQSFITLAFRNDIIETFSLIEPIINRTSFNPGIIGVPILSTCFFENLLQYSKIKNPSEKSKKQKTLSFISDEFNPDILNLFDNSLSNNNLSLNYFKQTLLHSNVEFFDSLISYFPIGTYSNFSSVFSDLFSLKKYNEIKLFIKQTHEPKLFSQLFAFYSLSYFHQKQKPFYKLNNELLREQFLQQDITQSFVEHRLLIHALDNLDFEFLNFINKKLPATVVEAYTKKQLFPQKQFLDFFECIQKEVLNRRISQQYTLQSNPIKKQFKL